MAKKDFSQVDTGRVYDMIAEATAEPEQEAQEKQQKKTAHKPRKMYSAQEAQEFKEQMKTSGHKGVKLPRINLAFAPDVYEYIQIMSRVRGDNLTAFVNLALRQHMKEHGDLYEKAKEFRDALDSL